MRPIKLTMCAFGPYAEKTVIEFDKLGENGIYLITGDTGAGKTTIFDAIVFTLYGEASSKKRKSTMFRSKYAKPETPTFAELVFQYRDKEYKIRRNPFYLRPKTRGEGFTEQNPSCELTLPNGNVLTKKTETENAINEIIGITREQFLQIAMIAQGDFLKLLLASTDERKEIFRHIFKTERFNQLQDKLKNENREAKELCDKAHNSMKQYIDGIICIEDNALFFEIEKAKNNELSILETILALEKLIEEDENSDKELSLKIIEFEKQLAEVNATIGRLEEINKAKQNFIFVTKRLQEKTKEREDLQEVLKVEKEKFRETEALNKDIAKIKAELPRYDELDLQLKKLELINKKLKSDDNALSDKNILLNRKSELLEAFNKEKSLLEKAGEDREKLSNEIGQAAEKLKKLESVLLTVKEYSLIVISLNEKQTQYLNALKIAQNALDEYNRKNTEFLNEQAGILAEQLKENAPCPVCGSTLHPCIAQKSEKAPTEAQLKKAKQKSDDAQKLASDASNECSQIKGQCETAKSNIEKQLEMLINNKDINSAESTINEMASQLKEAISNLKVRITEEEDKIKRKSDLEEIIPNTQNETEIIKTDIANLQTSVASHKAAISEISEQIESLKITLYFSDKNTAKKKQSELEFRAENLKKSYENAQNNFDVCEKEIIAQKAQLEQLSKQIENVDEINIEEVKTKQSDLNISKQIKIDERTAVLARLSANRFVLENIKKKMDEINEYEKRYILIKSLYETANGNITGKERIMLETYIQMTYFDRIIERANTRFMVMSGGQYEMKRRAVPDNNRSQSGLDIDVIDHYNGTERSINTLSGGESFKASLSLALGLSDEIQASAGGIRLDTMFVDEGFGSLDEESLNQAMNALKGLTEGNRLVGIISHVNELKERIDKQIVVKKDKLGGSTVNIIC